MKRVKKSKSISLNMGSLSECYDCLKKLLVGFIGKQEFHVTVILYRLLAEVSIFAKEYNKAIKYLIQAVIT
jgi:hypothetical protein